MSTLKRVAFTLYPIGILILLPFLISKDAHAGRIRKVELTETRPVVVWVYPGLPTNISFPTQVRPEKAMPGPQGMFQVDFLENNLIVTPVARGSGSLLVYTKTAKYVILLKPGNENSYDDMVDLILGVPSGRAFSARPLRLMSDSYQPLEVEISTKKYKQTFIALVSSNHLELKGTELEEHLVKHKKIHCARCVILRSPEFKISCTKPIQELKCTSDGNKAFTLRELR